MQVSFNAIASNLSDRDREYAEKKLQKLARYFSSAREARVTYVVQRNWQIVEVEVDLDGLILRAVEQTPEFRASIDAVLEKLESQVRRHKEKLKKHKGRADAPTVASIMAEVPDEPADRTEEPLPTVARRKQITIRPMSVEEAALQMELLHHDFFAFVNAETSQVNILYRRRERDYGVLELQE